jgi:hypothetical protein
MMIGGKKRSRQELIVDLWNVLSMRVHDFTNAEIIDLTFIIKEISTNNN